MSSRTLFVALALMLTPVLALAQVTYRCVGSDGHKYYGSTIPPQCYGKPVEQINKQGTVVRRIDPEHDAKERAEKEANLEKKKEEDAATREENRRNRALLATYTSDRDIEDTRRRALEDNEKAVKEVEQKIDGLKKTRAKYEKELDFYKDKKTGESKPPAKLSNDIANVDIDLKAQEDLLAAKKREVSVINAKYDEDKKRFADLMRKPANAR